MAETAMPQSWLDMLRRLGGEYGAATGRPRRVGPVDIPASRYGLKCQNADKIALTKLDVLSAFTEIPVITGYRYGDQVTGRFDPGCDLEKYEPVVETVPGWQQSISKCRTWEELPDNAKAYIALLEKLLDHEIQFVSVGAKRDEYLLKGSWI